MALTKIQDPDAWLHLVMGKSIWVNHGFPQLEPYVYSMFGRPFEYSSWLFGVVYFSVFKYFDINGVILFKAFTIAAVFYILLKDALRPQNNLYAALFIMPIIALLSAHRFVERPDSFLMLFLSSTIFSLNAFVYDHKKYIYLFPFIAALWVSSHSSGVLIAVPFGAFLVGGMVQRLLLRKGLRFSGTPTWPQLFRITIVFLLPLLLAVIATPGKLWGLVMGGVQFMQVDWYKQEIIELLPPSWDAYKLPFILTAVVVFSFVINWILSFRRRIEITGSFVSLLLILPFIYLALTSKRFLFLLAIVSGPILVRNLAPFFFASESKELNSSGRRGTKSVFHAALLTIWILLCAATALLRPEILLLDTMKFGFGIDYLYEPEGALRYLDSRNITGRVFNSTHFGQYITWRDFPRRSVIADGRFGVPVDLLDKMSQAQSVPLVLDELSAIYGFESIILYSPGINTEKSYKMKGNASQGVTHPGWALVYWDDVSLVYLKKKGMYDSVIKNDEYRYVNPAGNFSDIVRKFRNQSLSAGLVPELKRNIEMTGSEKAEIILGFGYTAKGEYRDAIPCFTAALEHSSQHNPELSHLGLAISYGELGKHDQAFRNYKKSLNYQKTANAYCWLGRLYLSRGDGQSALKAFKQAMMLDSLYTPAYSLLIDGYRQLGMFREAEVEGKKLKQVLTVVEAESHLSAGIQLSLSGNHEASVEEFKRGIAVYSFNPALYSALGFEYLKSDALELSYESQMKALAVDQNYADAHYGLALIYKKRGNRTLANTYWKNYLRLEPAGASARRAKAEMQAEP